MRPINFFEKDNFINKFSSNQYFKIKYYLYVGKFKIKI